MNAARRSRPTPSTGPLGSRNPSPVPIPPALARGIADALEQCAARGVIGDGVLTPEDYIAAAESLVDRLLHGGCESRSGALDLLVVDALVTYAFELAGDEPACIETRAERAMMRLAALAVPAGQPFAR